MYPAIGEVIEKDIYPACLPGGKGAKMSGWAGKYGRKYASFCICCVYPRLLSARPSLLA